MTKIVVGSSLVSVFCGLIGILGEIWLNNGFSFIGATILTMIVYFGLILTAERCKE